MTSTNNPGPADANPNHALLAASAQWNHGRLRRWLPEDAPRLVEAWSDPEISRWNAVPPQPTLEVASRWIAADQQRLDRLLSVDLVIDMDDHGVVGEVGLSSFNQRHRGALIGYWLLPIARGQGIAASAVSTASEWAFRKLNLDVLVAQCASDNLASQAVARNAEYVHERTDSSGIQMWRRYR